MSDTLTHPNRCDLCGRFRPWADLHCIEFTPDSDRSVESITLACTRCR